MKTGSNLIITAVIGIGSFLCGLAIKIDAAAPKNTICVVTRHDIDWEPAMRVEMDLELIRTMPHRTEESLACWGYVSGWLTPFPADQIMIRRRGVENVVSH